jgi:hypothetical protein
LWWLEPGCLPPPADPSFYSIKKNGKYALFTRSIDTTGYDFDSVKMFSNECIIVSKNGKWGFHHIYNNRLGMGDVVFREPMYEDIKISYYVSKRTNKIVYDGNIGFAAIKKAGKWGVIRACDFKELIKPKYYSIDMSYQTYFLVEYEPNYFGYIDYEGTEYFKR